MHSKAGGYIGVSYSVGTGVTIGILVLYVSFVVYITGFMLLVTILK